MAEAPEYAIGAVHEKGEKILNKEETNAIDQNWLKEEIKREHAEAQRRGKTYREGKDAIPAEGKTAILVDDGVATGLTMRLAVLSVKSQNPEKIIIAVPVSPEEAIGEFKKAGADEVITLLPPEDFLGSVGAHYAEFEQVEDGEVIRLMRSA